MVVSISGLGCTGSSAVEDLLREYDDMNGGMDDEFTLLYAPDGILDLEHHLVNSPQRFWSSDVAITRFIKFIKNESRSPRSFYNTITKGKFRELSLDYIHEICQMSWRGFWYVDLFASNELVRTIKFRIVDRFLRQYQDKTKKRVYSFVDRTMYLSVRPDNFYEATKKYLNNLFEAMGYDIKGNIFVNQLFAGNNPQSGMQFFDDAKAIIVDRDPRDVYVLLKKYQPVVHWYAIETVEEFVDYFRYVREGAGASLENVLYVQFEDLVYSYDEEVSRIEKFLNISQHTRKKQKFCPEKSKNNTQLFLYADDLKSDIAYIEENLQEYLYDFSNCMREEIDRKTVF